MLTDRASPCSLVGQLYIYIYFLKLMNYYVYIYMSCMWSQPHKLAWKTLVTCTCDHTSVAWTPMQCNLLPTPRNVRHLGQNVWELLRLKSHPLWMSRCMNLIYIQIYKNYIVHRLYKYISISVQECNFGTILHEFLPRTYICMYIVWAQGEGRLSSTYFSCSSLKICEPVLNALVQGFELSLDTRGTYNI